MKRKWDLFSHSSCWDDRKGGYRFAEKLRTKQGFQLLHRRFHHFEQLSESRLTTFSAIHGLVHLTSIILHLSSFHRPLFPYPKIGETKSSNTSFATTPSSSGSILSRKPTSTSTLPSHPHRFVQVALRPATRPIHGFLISRTVLGECSGCLSSSEAIADKLVL
jgi:hypothetical protein